MFGYETMCTYRDTGASRALQLFNVQFEMLRPVTFGCFKRIDSLNTKTTERTVRDIGGEFIEYIKVATDIKIADNAVKNTCNTLHALSTRDTFTARFFIKIATAFHGPVNHTGLCWQQFNDA